MDAVDESSPVTGRAGATGTVVVIAVAVDVVEAAVLVVDEAVVAGVVGVVAVAGTDTTTDRGEPLMDD